MLGTMGKISTARVYDVRNGKQTGNAAMFLVDRLWPRGVKKESLPLTGWPKELTPSADLRKELHGGQLDWDQFSGAYRAELDGRHRDGELDDALAAVGEALGEGDVLLLFAGKDTDHTHARILQEWLEDQFRAVAADPPPH